MRRIARIVVIGIAVLPVVAAIAYIAWMVGCDGMDRASWDSKPFSAHEWRTADQYSRYHYVDDLMKSKKLNGLSSEQLRAMLGPPDYEEDEYFKYVLKPMHCYWEDWTLDIGIKNGKVEGYGVRQT